MKVAKQRKSGVLASNAVHHRVDSLTGMVALAAITGSHFISNAAWLDPIGGFLVSLLVIRAGWGNTRAAVMELADVGVDESVKIEIKESIQHYVDETKITINNVQGVKSGPNYLMDVDLAVPQSWTVEQTSKAEEELRDQIGAKVRGVRRLKIRFLSQEAIAADPNSIDEFIAADSQGYNILSTRHDHDHQDHKDEKKQV
jgi:divalent metal cation (Fe/Co/Zn/Cd) transporter